MAQSRREKIVAALGFSGRLTTDEIARVDKVSSYMSKHSVATPEAAIKAMSSGPSAGGGSGQSGPGQQGAIDIGSTDFVGAAAGAAGAANQRSLQGSYTTGVLLAAQRRVAQGQGEAAFEEALNQYMADGVTLPDVETQPLLRQAVLAAATAIPHSPIKTLLNGNGLVDLSVGGLTADMRSLKPMQLEVPALPEA